MFPDATGTFEDAGEHNGKRYYARTFDPNFLWWDGVDTWYISHELGIPGAGYWSRTDPDIEGNYDPTLPATGIATVTEI